jgi:hypothetical protein
LHNWLKAGCYALISGTTTSLALAFALAMLARAERKGGLQPLNATSHWLHGEQAGFVTGADAAHTLVGYGTHHASAWFWALLFERWLIARRPRAAAALFRDGALMAAIAAAVDYGMTPKRLTPGWETVLSKRAIATAYVAMAVGLTAGALVTQRLRQYGNEVPPDLNAHSGASQAKTLAPSRK